MNGGGFMRKEINRQSNAPRHQRRGTSGFTLIELLVVVAIVAILAAVAIPNYAKYAYRSRRADGKTEIMRMANQQERFYTANNAYDTSAGAQFSEKGYYSVSIANGSSGTSQTYVLTATPRNAQTADKCGNLTITETGVKGWSGDESNGKCW